MNPLITEMKGGGGGAKAKYWLAQPIDGTCGLVLVLVVLSTKY